MKTILIADEYITVRNFIRLMFTEEMGYRVVATSNGVDAVVKVKEIAPDVVLADVSLPDKSGYEVSREIKINPSLKNTCVVLLTASPETFDETKAAKVHADDFIIKPFEPKELIQRVKFLINKEKLNRISLKTAEREGFVNLVLKRKLREKG